MAASGTEAPTIADGELAEAHRRLLADDTIQFDLPAYVVPEPPAWAKSLDELFSGLGPYMVKIFWVCLLYTSPSPRDGLLSRMPSSA